MSEDRKKEIVEEIKKYIDENLKLKYWNSDLYDIENKLKEKYSDLNTSEKDEIIELANKYWNELYDILEEYKKSKEKEVTFSDFQPEEQIIIIRKSDIDINEIRKIFNCKEMEQKKLYNFFKSDKIDENNKQYVLNEIISDENLKNLYKTDLDKMIKKLLSEEKYKKLFAKRGSNYFDWKSKVNTKYYKVEDLILEAKGEGLDLEDKENFGQEEIQFLEQHGIKNNISKYYFDWKSIVNTNYYNIEDLIHEAKGEGLNLEDKENFGQEEIQFLRQHGIEKKEEKKEEKVESKEKVEKNLVYAYIKAENKKEFLDKLDNDQKIDLFKSFGREEKRVIITTMSDYQSFYDYFTNQKSQNGNFNTRANYLPEDKNLLDIESENRKNNKSSEYKNPENELIVNYVNAENKHDFINKLTDENKLKLIKSFGIDEKKKIAIEIENIEEFYKYFWENNRYDVDGIIAVRGAAEGWHKKPKGDNSVERFDSTVEKMEESNITPENKEEGHVSKEQLEEYFEFVKSMAKLSDKELEKFILLSRRKDLTNEEKLKNEIENIIGKSRTLKKNGFINFIIILSVLLSFLLLLSTFKYIYK